MIKSIYGCITRILWAVWAWLTIHRQCSWCKQWMHIAPAAMFVRDPQKHTSHGICKSCGKKWMENI